MTGQAQAWVEVDLDALDHNMSILNKVAGGADLAAVVKANAYGHGAPAIAGAVIRAGAGRVCVYNLDEAEALRLAGFAAPVLVLGSCPPPEMERALELDVALMVSDLAVLGALVQAAQRRDRVADVHVKMETGMYRLGLRADQAVAMVDAVRAEPALHLEGFCTHFPSADGPDADDTRERFARFLSLADRIRAPIRHVANTATLLRYPEMALEMVRLGGGLYGMMPDGWEPVDLRPVLEWKAVIVRAHDVPAGDSVSYGGLWTAERDSRIGVVAVGYADGFRRALSRGGSVLVRGRRAPVVGSVCMDMFMVDLTDVRHATAGDVATLIGRDGAASVTVRDMARACDSIPYEICTGLGNRLSRVYLRAGRPVLVQGVLDRAPQTTSAASARAAVLAG